MVTICSALTLQWAVLGPCVAFRKSETSVNVYLTTLRRVSLTGEYVEGACDAGGTAPLIPHAESGTKATVARKCARLP